MIQNYYANTFQMNLLIKCNYRMSQMMYDNTLFSRYQYLFREFIDDIGDLVRTDYRYGCGNPSGLYSDYALFKRRFVSFWSRRLYIADNDKQELEAMFDSILIPQDCCRNINATTVFFDNGLALSVDECMNAMCDVIERFV